jgi:hypothetical protein
LDELFKHQNHTAKTSKPIKILGLDLIVADDIISKIIFLEAIKMFTGGGRLFND